MTVLDHMKAAGYDPNAARNADDLRRMGAGTNDATKTILPSKEALNEFLKAHKYKSFPTAVEAARNGKKLVFIFLDWETYGDRSYYYCKEDDTVYSDYLSIGD